MTEGTMRPRPDLTPAVVRGRLVQERDRLLHERLRVERLGSTAGRDRAQQMGREIQRLSRAADLAAGIAGDPGVQLPQAVRLEQVGGIVATSEQPVVGRVVAERLGFSQGRASDLLTTVREAAAGAGIEVPRVRRRAR